jgi:hypothetical protein
MVGGYLFINLSLWAINAVILIFLGGMMILFLYVCTLRNYEKLFLSLGWPQLGGALLFAVSGPFSSFSLRSCDPSHNLLEFSFLFKSLQIGGLLFTATYLLLRLFRVVKVSESFKGTLVKYL